MKQFFYTILFVAISIAAYSQTETNAIATNLSIGKVGENMVISWTENKATDGSWEVQASIDGKTFETVGLVWGSDPKAARNSFAFKQELIKVQSKYAFYRVLYAEANAELKASKAIEFSK
ncbi:MAG TPA: hypothetical protein PK504_08875 [Ferruginibacter sp.]|nr:hypothetical protein [Ferruginibacter sp.]HRE63301.1 hypothetical protein [Ferruginibacter sp.]